MNPDSEQSQNSGKTQRRDGNSRRSKVLAILMLLSAIDIDIGGFILREQGLVPLSLTISTFAASAVIVVVAVLILYTEGKRGEFTGLILGCIAIVVSTNPSHLSALEKFGSSASLAAADVTMLIGFYILPVLYIILFLVYRKKGRLDAS